MITIQEDKGIVYLSNNKDNIAYGISFKLEALPFKQICKLIYFFINYKLYLNHIANMSKVNFGNNKSKYSEILGSERKEII